MTNVEPTAERTFIPGIGRPLDPAWVEQFVDATRRILPRTIELKPRKSPGIIYVSSDRLAGKPKLEADNDDERLLRLQRYTSSIISSLSAKGELDRQVATSPVDLSLHKPQPIQFKHAKRSYITILINVDDIPIDANKDYGYQIESERDEFFNRFPNDGNRAATREHPRHHAVIGQFSGFTPAERLLQIARALPEPVPLLGVSALDLSVAR